MVTEWEGDEFDIHFPRAIHRVSKGYQAAFIFTVAQRHVKKNPGAIDILEDAKLGLIQAMETDPTSYPPGLRIKMGELAGILQLGTDAINDLDEPDFWNEVFNSCPVISGNQWADTFARHISLGRALLKSYNGQVEDIIRDPFLVASEAYLLNMELRLAEQKYPLRPRTLPTLVGYTLLGDIPLLTTVESVDMD